VNFGIECGVRSGGSFRTLVATLKMACVRISAKLKVTVPRTVMSASCETAEPSISTRLLLDLKGLI
jgi:hypothetical protein